MFSIELPPRGHIAFTTHDENVLTPEGMLKLLELHRTVNSVKVDGKVYNDFCFKIPITDLFGGGDKKREDTHMTSAAPLLPSTLFSRRQARLRNSELGARSQHGM